MSRNNTPYREAMRIIDTILESKQRQYDNFNKSIESFEGAKWELQTQIAKLINLKELLIKHLGNPK